MAKQSRYPLEVRERAVRLVLENTGEYGSEWSAIVSNIEQDRLFAGDAAEVG